MHDEDIPLIDEDDYDYDDSHGMILLTQAGLKKRHFTETTNGQVKAEAETAA